VNPVLAGWKFGVARMELEWDVDFKVSNDLRFSLARTNRKRKHQGEEQQRQLISSRPLWGCVSLLKGFNKHGDFSPFLSPRKDSVRRATQLEEATELPNLLIA
jgi:hypothetical protein